MLLRNMLSNPVLNVQMDDAQEIDVRNNIIIESVSGIKIAH